MNWSDIDFVLGQFGLPTSDSWTPGASETESQFNYIRQMLGLSQVRDDELLDEYLSGDDGLDPDEAPWEHAGRFRLFVTHVATFKSAANKLKGALTLYGIDAFVAHEDIEPGEWLQQVVAALRAMRLWGSSTTVLERVNGATRRSALSSVAAGPWCQSGSMRTPMGSLALSRRRREGAAHPGHC